MSRDLSSDLNPRKVHLVDQSSIPNTPPVFSDHPAIYEQIDDHISSHLQICTRKIGSLPDDHQVVTSCRLGLMWITCCFFWFPATEECVL